MICIGAPQETQTTWGGKKRSLLPLILFDGFNSPLFPRENLLTWGSSHRGQIGVEEKKKTRNSHQPISSGDRGANRLPCTVDHSVLGIYPVLHTQCKA